MEEAPITIHVEIDGAEKSWITLSLRVEEAINRILRGSLRARTEDFVDGWEDLDALLGKPITVRLVCWDDSERPFHGVITQLEQDLESDGSVVLEIVFEAPFVVLGYGTNSRLWLEKTVEEVVTEVLGEAALPHEVSWELSETYEPHEQITQYQESDLALVTRLLEEEGISFCTYSEMGGPALRFFDDSTRVDPVPNDELYNFTETARGTFRQVRALTEELVVASDAVSFRDYDLRVPATDLTCKTESDDATGREVYVHPGQFVDPTRGDRLAGSALQKLRARCRVVRGIAAHPDVEAGRRFQLQNAERLDLAGELILLSVVHEIDATERGYAAHFEAAPIDVPQPPRSPARAAWPHGGHVAWVTGPAGEEIHTNDYGRIRVRFPWDRSGITDDKSSTWLRVGQLALGGSMILPRVGFEVMVDFEMGDLDRPAIAGHLYNMEAPPPYALPANKTKSSLQTNTTGGGPGANELRFEDTAGGEEMFVNASKDWTTNTANDASLATLVDATIDIGSNHNLGVGAGHTLNVTSTRSLSVGANQNIDVTGNYTDIVGADCTIDIGGARMVKVGGDHVEEVGGSYTRSVGSLQSILGIGGFQRKVTGSSTVTVGAAHAELAGGSRAIDIKGSFTETIGALKMIKSKGVAINAGGAYMVNAAAVQVKAGAGRNDSADGAVALTAGGSIDIKAGGNVNIAASSRLVIRGGGTTITLTSAGTAEIKASTIIVKNAEALNQAMHKSN